MKMLDITSRREKTKSTITISPDKESWERFSEIVEQKYGKKKQSAVVDTLIEWFNKNADYDFPLTEMKDTGKRTLFISVDNWDEFSEKVYELYSKYKVKSAAISTLIQKYINGEIQIN